jgi:sec-independent protein translocase protein TatA
VPFGVGVWELVVLLGVLLLVFGPKRLPEMGRSLGTSVRELRASLSGAMPAEPSGPAESELEETAGA